ncbi:MAG: ATP-binding cassette domain-containing protein [Leptospiraceae bacterium]|nr:ATP-binding cassette domain-containing protein [Leptospiraceae bacterium]
MSVVLELKNISIQINKKEIVTNVNLVVEECSITGLVGASGSGKTTLFRGILNELSSSAKRTGEILLLGNSIHKKFDPRIQSVNQEASLQFNPKFSLREILSEPLEIQKYAIEKIHSELERILGEISISIEKLDQNIMQFSGGEQQRIQIGRALLTNPKILLMDEPVTGLDRLMLRKVKEILLNQKNKFSILIITHDLEFASEVCDTIYIMKEGKILENGETKMIFKNSKNEYTKELLKSLDLNTIKQKNN